MATRRVLLLTNELATVTAVSSGLQTNGKLAPEDTCRDFRELSERLQLSHAPAALVDIDEPGALATLETLVRRFADTKFIVLANTLDSQRMLEAMQIGARHYLVKNSIASELSGVLHRICPNGVSGAGGMVFTILSAGGGCGATTLAVNLAAELQLAASAAAAGGSRGAAATAGGAGGRALVVDLDTCYGAVGPYLGVDGEYGILDLLARQGHIDADLIETSSIAYGETGGLRVLIATSANRLGNEQTLLDPGRVSAAAMACAAHSPATVIDAPRLPLPVAAELIRASDLTLLLMQLTVKDIRAARRMLTSLAPAGGGTVPGSRGGGITAVVSRYAKRGAMITLAEAQKALGDFELATLCNDYNAASQSLNLGKPLAQAAPRSDLRREIQQLAARLVAAHARPSSGSSGAGTKW